VSEPGPELRDQEIRAFPRRLVRIVDYLLVPTDGPADATPAGRHGAVELGDGVRIEQLDAQLVDRVFSACALRGEDWDPTRQFGAVHAYTREVWSDEDGDEKLPSNIYAWDGDHRIWPAVHLSRLVRDNGTSTEFAVRRLVRFDGSESLVPFSGFASHVVYRLYPERRGWLDHDEARQLRQVINAYGDGQHLPKRVQRALRRSATITRERYLEDAVPLAVGGLEALVKVGRNYARAQFSQRVPALAAEFDICLSIDRCAEVYDDRSALVHGADVDLSVRQDLDEFGRAFIALQETQRRAVRRAIEDPGFADLFASDDGIVNRWPARISNYNGEKRV
jgi:hypothetical protein